MALSRQQWQNPLTLTTKLTTASFSARNYKEQLDVCTEIQRMSEGVMVDGRLGSRLRGYHPVAPRALCAPPLVPPVVSRGAPRQAT
jgi:hypothetical protein